MKKTLLLAAALGALTFAQPALAAGDPHHGGHGGHHGGGDRHGHGGGGSHRGGEALHGRGGHGFQHGGQAVFSQGHRGSGSYFTRFRGAEHGQRDTGHAAAHRRFEQGHVNVHRGHQNFRGGVNVRGGGGRHIVRGNFHARRHFHAGAYRWPHGYRHRHWRYGEYLPRIFFGRDYWLTNYWAFNLFPPPYGYVWVRVGPDALLIDRFTGEIVRVDYDVFY